MSVQTRSGVSRGGQILRRLGGCCAVAAVRNSKNLLHALLVQLSSDEPTPFEEVVRSKLVETLRGI